MKIPTPLPLTADDCVRMEQRARRFAGAWTGTSGTLAADVMRLLWERQRLLGVIAERTIHNGCHTKGGNSDTRRSD